MKNDALIKFCDDNRCGAASALGFGLVLGVFTLGIGLLACLGVAADERFSYLTDEKVDELLSRLKTAEEKKLVHDAYCNRKGKLRKKDLEPLRRHVHAVAASARAEYLEGALGPCPA